MREVATAGSLRQPFPAMIFTSGTSIFCSIAGDLPDGEMIFVSQTSFKAVDLFCHCRIECCQRQRGDGEYEVQAGLQVLFLWPLRLCNSSIRVHCLLLRV